MDKKQISNIVRVNMYVLIFILGTSISFVMGIKSILLNMKLSSANIESVDFSVFSLSITTNVETFNALNIPIIIAMTGLLYNIFFIVKNKLKNKQEDKMANTY